MPRRAERESDDVSHGRWPPFDSGTLTCIGTSSGTVEDLNDLSGATKKEIGEWKRYWTDNGFCERNTVDTSGLTQDP